MKKKLLAISVLAAISSQASAFQFDTSDDWKIRWDNTFKANVVARVNKADKQVTEDSAGWLLARDSDWSVDRSGGGLVSTRIDVLSEMDVIWKNRFGFRVSGSGWYDPQYKSSNNDYPDERNATSTRRKTGTTPVVNFWTPLCSPTSISAMPPSVSGPAATRYTGVTACWGEGRSPVSAAR